MSEASLLVGDIGGTNARFALASRTSPGFTDEVMLKCADYESADIAIKHYLETVGATAPEVICLAAAGPIVDQRVRFTNNPWSIAADALAAEISSAQIRLLNDFEAIALSLPFLKSDDILAIGLPDTVALGERDYTVGALGPGTGLGMVGLIKRGDQLIPIASEGSHNGFAPETQVQLDILTVLREQFDRVSAERLVSGAGLENIYSALTRIHGDNRPQLSAAEIFARANHNSESRSAEAVHVFFEVLGQVAGDFALQLGAEDGVFIAGGIARRYPVMMANSSFRTGFENKGRHRSLLERIPTQLIMHEHPGLLGASYCALELLHTAS